MSRNGEIPCRGGTLSPRVDDAHLDAAPGHRLLDGNETLVLLALLILQDEALELLLLCLARQLVRPNVGCDSRV